MAGPLVQNAPGMTAPVFPIIAVENAHVRFGEVIALNNVSLHVNPAECIGLVGHNGAGKSTIVNVINGGLTPQQGQMSGDGAALPAYSIGIARSQGVRCVFQELSLCPNLTIIENTRLMHRNLTGLNWRTRARRVISASLDTIFPGHGLDPRAQVGTLSIAQRQMVEIAMAFSDAGIAPRLVILDEPTSSLDAGLAAQLLTYVRKFVAAGGAVILISHILSEILSTCTRIVVMKDAQIVVEKLAQDFTQTSLVTAMGSVTHAAASRRDIRSSAPILELQTKGLPLSVRQGEVIGLAGLGGHGQTDALLALFDTQSPNWWPARAPAVTFVAGDRRLNGVFDLWSILRNMSVASLPDMARRGMVQTATEIQSGADWKTKIGIRTPDMNNRILSLSGGNQQKVLFARALSTRAPVVLMDDPMRGVDVGTKQEVYDMIWAEADAGRTFIWYSTEMDEMQLCDRVYVFRERAIVADLTGAQITENAILAASFKAEAA